GSPRRGHGRRRHRGGGRRGAGDRASAHAGARVAANPGCGGGRHMADVRRAAVIGTGTMGPGMGAVLARVGIDTTLYDVSDEALERAKAGVELAGSVLERLDAPRTDGGDVRFESDLASALDGVELVLEAVPEKLELKHAVFGDLERHVAED